MTRVLIAAALVFASTSFGCSRETAQEPPASEAAPAEPAETKAPVDSTHGLFDAQGRLLESKERIAGLVLPRGLEPARKTARKHVYRSTVPIRKLLEYFGPRLFTGSVERIGDGAIYRNASVQGVLRSSVKLDVSILRIGKNLTRVAIKEIPPPPEEPPSLQETRSEAYDQMKTLY